MSISSIIGNKESFGIGYSFFDETRETELEMYINGKNILAFERAGRISTTRWNLDELAMWLRNFLDNLADDPFPIDCAGEFAAEKDDAARDFDSNDDEEFDSYYQKLYEWDQRHRWHSASSGAILADVFFQLKNNCVEISWDNRSLEENVVFQNDLGGALIEKNCFNDTINAFLREYALHWFS